MVLLLWFLLSWFFNELLYTAMDLSMDMMDAKMDPKMDAGGADIYKKVITRFPHLPSSG